jgi:hypothetical protein
MLKKLDKSKPKTKYFDPEDTGVIEFKFPIAIKESLTIKVSNSYIKRAKLIANNVLLGEFLPVYDIYSFDVFPPEIELDFFGHLPFHAGLAVDWEMHIIIYAFVNDSDSRHEKYPNGVDKLNLPSVSYYPAEVNLTWDEIAIGDTPKEYRQDVIIATGVNRTNPRELTLLYTPKLGGFLPK